MSEIQFATVLPGAKTFDVGNVNQTFRGQILLEDGTVKAAIIKDLDHKELANELLANVLARAMHLPTPDAYLALVRGTDLDVGKAPRLADGNCLVFASTDVKLPNITFCYNADPQGRQKLLQDIMGWNDIANLYAFDSWVANVDRHAGNLLFGGKDEIWLIDHGRCFTGPDWQPDELAPHSAYRNRLSEWLTPHFTLEQKKKRAPEIQKFASAIATIEISEASEKSHLDLLISSEHIAAVESFLKDRTDYVVFSANNALGVPTLL